LAENSSPSIYVLFANTFKLVSFKNILLLFVSLLFIDNLITDASIFTFFDFASIFVCWTSIILLLSLLPNIFTPEAYFTYTWLVLTFISLALSVINVNVLEFNKYAEVSLE
jgi:hypothetical protein